VASPLFMNSLQEVDARTLRRDQVERVLGLLAKEGITPPGIAQSKLTAEKELLAWIERGARRGGMFVWEDRLPSEHGHASGE
jgi:hypothetical protein